MESFQGPKSQQKNENLKNNLQDRRRQHENTNFDTEFSRRKTFVKHLISNSCEKHTFSIFDPHFGNHNDDCNYNIIEYSLLWGPGLESFQGPKSQRKKTKKMKNSKIIYRIGGDDTKTPTLILNF